MASIFSIRNAMKPEIYLGLDNVFDCSVFHCRELFVKAGMITLELVNLMSNVQQFHWAKEGTKVLGPEWRSLMELSRHGWGMIGVFDVGGL
jgi:hypothetical protein